MPRKMNKYGNNKTPYKGIMWDSEGEALYAWELDQKAQRGDIALWIPKPRLCILLGKTKAESIFYTPDYWVVPSGLGHRPEDDSYYLDFKGVITPAFRRVVKMWKLTQPYILRTVNKKGEFTTWADGVIQAEKEDAA